MDQRKSERVQFFNLGDDEKIKPVWVFRQTSPDAILGLLVDISSEGIQVLTDKAYLLKGDLFQLTIHLDEANSVAILGNHKWSQDEGTLYIRNGFALEEGEDSLGSVPKLMALHHEGKQWLRCEILGLAIPHQDRL